MCKSKTFASLVNAQSVAIVVVKISHQRNCLQVCCMLQTEVHSFSVRFTWKKYFICVAKLPIFSIPIVTCEFIKLRDKMLYTPGGSPFQCMCGVIILNR